MVRVYASRRNMTIYDPFLILSFWLWLCRTASSPLCEFALTAYVGFKRSEHTRSVFLLSFILYRWTASVTCTGSSLFAVVMPILKDAGKGYALISWGGICSSNRSA
jgi:hypothetical protein